MQGLNFIAIDFETATGKRASICEAGICIVYEGKIAKTCSWLVRPQGNYYNYWNMRLHGIGPKDTKDSPEFPEVWAEISDYLKDCPVLVSHNAAFDIGCIRHSLELYGLEKPDVTYYCSLRAGSDAEMCARLFLREIRDAGYCELEEMNYCNGRL